MRLFVSCAPGLEAILEGELGSLGVASTKRLAGGVECDGELALLYRLNLELGVAQQVRLRLGSFGARRFPQLVRGVAELDWAPWLAPGRALRVRASARKSRLYHTGAIVERVREGIARALGSEAPEGEEGTPLVHARIERDRCTLSIDTSGEPLHRRGYRLRGTKAPLREDLARALVLASGWDAASPLVDPLAGAGTIPIEAALFARRLAPGRARRFAFMDAPGFDESTWERVLAGARAREVPSLAFPIAGSDRDAGAVDAAAENAERAGVSGDVRFDRASLSASPLLKALPGPSGALVTHPPYGKRVGDPRALRDLYRSLGARVAELPEGWRVGIVVAASTPLWRSLGVELHGALLTDQGGVKVRFLTRGA